MPLLDVLPVTAIACIHYTGVEVVLVGRGRKLVVHDARIRTQICEVALPITQAVHGIIALSKSVPEPRQDLVVFAGRAIVWITVCLEVIGGSFSDPTIEVRKTAQVQDWVLCGKPQDYVSSSAVLVTSYNDLVKVSLDQLTNQIETTVLCDTLSTFLYSADLLAINVTTYIVASGTAFGEVLTWLCGFDSSRNEWKAYPWREFGGHSGSIFGISISPTFTIDNSQHRILASCSDDRTIRTWDLSNIEELAQDSSKLAIERKGGADPSFVHHTQSLADTWAHLSRIWHVNFATRHNTSLSSNRCLLLSTGEDGQVQSWSVNLAGLFQYTPPKSDRTLLIHENTDRHHAGKNIWARCIYANDDQTVLFTGGADGQIVSRSYTMRESQQDRMQHLTQPFQQIHAKALDGLMQRHIVLRSYLMTQASEVIATSVAGDLLKGFVRNGTVVWHLIEQDEGRKPLVVAPIMASGFLSFAKQSAPSLHMTGASSQRSQEICKLRASKISIVEIVSLRCTQERQEACIAISYHNSCDLELVWATFSSAVPEVSRTSALLPRTFEVTSICYDAEAQVLLCGSRAGAITVYIDVNNDTANIESVLCHRHVHGQDTVTSIQTMKDTAFNANDSAAHYLTTGRDGHYCVLKLVTSASNPSKPTATFQMLHQASPPTGQNIEGANLVLQPNGTTKLLLHGFQSKHFVVWDETNHTQILSIDCGGAHRSWAFQPTETGEGGTFVWTKAGNFMYANQEDADHKVIQHGGHGREIKALALHEVEKGRYLIATGSEDTDIRLWEYNTDTGVKNISVLRRHTTGLQDLHFSPDGRKLISAAGMEELFIWQLSRIPVLGMGVVFMGALSSTDTQSDARIMSFDVGPVAGREDDDALLIIAAFSNGKAKLINYQPTGLDSAGLGSFGVLQLIDMGELCLTQAHFLPHPSGIAKPLQAFIAATNGHIAHHNTSLLEPSYFTKGRWQHRVHQNNITTLQTLVLTAQHNLIVTGSDDSALAFTLCFTPPNASQPLYRSLVVPKAHAAALTALIVIDPTTDPEKTSAVNDDREREGTKAQQKHITVVTAGNDQRVQTWSVVVDIAMLQSVESDNNTNVMTGSKSMDEIQVELVGELYTNVADISNMALIGSDINYRHAQVLVVGVGMEIVDIKLPTTVR